MFEGIRRSFENRISLKPYIYILGAVSSAANYITVINRLNYIMSANLAFFNIFFNLFYQSLFFFFLKLFKFYLTITHCIDSPTLYMYWKSPISILGTLGYEILDIPKEKLIYYLQTVETLIRRCVLWSDLVCNICQLPFKGSPYDKGLRCQNIQGHYLTV